MFFGVLIAFALFVCIFGIILGFQQCVIRSAAWALLLMLFSMMMTTFVLPFSVPAIGVIYSLEVILLTFMRFGMEQAEKTARRRRARPNWALADLFDNIADYAESLEETAAFRRFFLMKISQIPLMTKLEKWFESHLPDEEAMGEMKDDATFVLRQATDALADVHHSRQASWMYRLCGVAAIGLAILKAYYIVTGQYEDDLYKKQLVEVADRELDYAWVASKYLGEFLARKYPGSEALLINGMVSIKEEGAYDRVLEGLQEGFAGKVKLAAEQPIPWESTELFIGASPEPGEEELPPPPRPEEFGDPTLRHKKAAEMADDRGRRFSTQAMDGWIERYPDCDVVISNVGLPLDFSAKTMLSMKKPEERPKIIALNVNLKGLMPAIKNGLITAVVAYNPRAKVTFKGEDRGDCREVFQNRFLLITAENVEEIAVQYPELRLNN